MRYTHHFEVVISNDFQSEIEDFDRAFTLWSQRFTDEEALRMRLLNANSSLTEMSQNIEFIKTVDVYKLLEEEDE